MCVAVESAGWDVGCFHLRKSSTASSSTMYMFLFMRHLFYFILFLYCSPNYKTYSRSNAILKKKQHSVSRTHVCMLSKYQTTSKKIQVESFLLCVERSQWLKWHTIKICLISANNTLRHWIISYFWREKNISILMHVSSKMHSHSNNPLYMLVMKLNLLYTRPLKR